MRFPSFSRLPGAAISSISAGSAARRSNCMPASSWSNALALTFQFWKRGTLTGLALAVIGIAVIFGSVLVHELAHALYARRS